MAAHVHTETFRVAMAEVDVAQIHFTAIHRWMDRGLCEWLREVGYPFRRILVEGPGIPIVNVNTRITGRILLDDEVTLRTHIGGIGRTSFRSLHRVTRGDELMVEGELVHVCVDRERRVPVPVPEWLRERAADGSL